MLANKSEIGIPIAIDFRVINIPNLRYLYHIWNWIIVHMLLLMLLMVLLVLLMMLLLQLNLLGLLGLVLLLHDGFRGIERISERRGLDAEATALGLGFRFWGVVIIIFGSSLFLVESFLLVGGFLFGELFGHGVDFVLDLVLAYGAVTEVVEVTVIQFGCLN